MYIFLRTLVLFTHPCLWPPTSISSLDLQSACIMNDVKPNEKVNNVSEKLQNLLNGWLHKTHVPTHINDTTYNTSLRPKMKSRLSHKLLA